jgi:predicted dehydrogenase
MNSRRNFIKTAAFAGATLGMNNPLFAVPDEINADLPHKISDYSSRHIQQFNMAGFAAPKISTVRVGVIGLGNRGPNHVKTMSRLEGVEIRALCDLLPERVETVKKTLDDAGHKPELYSGSKDEWMKLCEQPDLDLIIITTPWYLHAQMGIHAMKQGKHVLSEVPAAGTIEECWQLVETAEQTRKHFMMMENYSYMEFQLQTLNMARQGFFGDIVHGEGAYNTSKMSNNFSKEMYWDMWWLKQYAWRKGNFYPTHGLGPVSQWMSINRGDRFDYLVSVESNDFMMNARAKELSATDDFFNPFVGKDYRGNMNITVIRTKQGRTIMLQHDATSPSPHNLIHGLYGTKGAVLYDPHPPRISTGDHNWVSQKECDAIKETYTPEILKKMLSLTKNSGHGGSDLLLGWHVIDCLHNGLPLPQDVYDAASLSAIVPLSEWSVNHRSGAIDIPDFTAGAWTSNPQNMDIHIEKGGNTQILKG